MDEDGLCPDCRKRLKKTGKRLLKAVKVAMKQEDLELIERLEVALVFRVDSPKTEWEQQAPWN